jgi:hypothetical protein
LGLVVLLVFGVRLVVVSSLAAPMWGDSYQHALIAQLMTDHGGLFDSWEPYAPFETFTIHYGFHAATALFHWTTGVDVTRSTLVVGQILNGLAVVSLYPLAVRLSGRRWAGVAVIIIAGLLAPMPMYYVNWGRYAQLAGQVVLPVAAWFLIDALESPRWEARRLVSAALAAAGLFLCYYRAGFFYAAFALSWWIVHGWVHWRGDLRRWLDSVLRVAALGLAAGALILPQALKLSQGYLVEAIGQQSAEPGNWEAIIRDYRMWRRVDFYTPWPLLGLAAAGLAGSLARRRWTFASVGLWAAMLSALTLTAMLQLPGAGMVTNSAVLIGWYMPVSLLGSWVVGEAVDWASRQKRRLWQAALVGLLLCAGLWGAKERMGVVDRDFEMVTHADQAAMSWMAENLPADALVLVNGFAVYGDTSVVGSDGGWWLPLLARRQTVMPPQYALLNERPSQPGYLQRVTRIVLDLQETPATQPDGQRVLCENGITHLYAGQGQGLVGKQAKQLIPASELAESVGFEVLYHQDRVWVFGFDRNLCAD